MLVFIYNASSYERGILPKPYFAHAGLGRILFFIPNVFFNKFNLNNYASIYTFW